MVCEVLTTGSHEIMRVRMCLLHVTTYHVAITCGLSTTRVLLLGYHTMIIGYYFYWWSNIWATTELLHAGDIKISTKQLGMQCMILCGNLEGLHHVKPYERQFILFCQYNIQICEIVKQHSVKCYHGNQVTYYSNMSQQLNIH